MMWLRETCRICAHTATERIKLVTVFGDEGIKQDLQYKLYNCLKILVTRNDRLPTVLCEFCISRINAYYNLLQDCWKGQTYFATIPNIYTEPIERSTSNMSSPQETKSEPETSAPPHSRLEIEPEGKLLVKEEYESSSISSPESISISVKQEQDDTSQSDCDCLDLSAKASSSVRPVPEGSPKRRRSGNLQCSYCEKVFTHRGDFNKHLRKHTGEQPYECPICQKKFAHTSNLTRHKLVHSGDLPFECEKCHRRFNRKDKLAAHKRCKVTVS